MSIAILYDRSKTEEIGIKLTAKELGINLVYLPFRKISICLDKGRYSVRSKGKNYSKVVEDVNVILNRAQSKNRRLFSANILEAFGKYVINPSCIESVCFSKLRTLLGFWKEGIGTPRTVYVPCDPNERMMNGSKVRNEEDIADLIQQELGSENIVVKPDAGTHGNMVKLAKKREDLLMFLRETEASIVNPIGVLAQELVQKWFYDLRIIVDKESRKAPRCYPKALARAGFKDFRTNTYLGNMVFAVNLPPHIMDKAVKCGETIGKNSEAWVLGLDAMLDIGEDKIAKDEYIKSELDKLEPSFKAIKKVKNTRTTKNDFSRWNKRLEEAFQNYMNQPAYENVRRIIQESVERKNSNALFHEANSCPEFWEQTRLVAGINLAVPLLKCAQSVIESSHDFSLTYRSKFQFATV